MFILMKREQLTILTINAEFPRVKLPLFLPPHCYNSIKMN